MSARGNPYFPGGLLRCLLADVIWTVVKAFNLFIEKMLESGFTTPT
jgi:hypothetical protein